MQVHKTTGFWINSERVPEVVIYQTPTDWRGFGGVALPDRLLVVDLLMNAMMINDNDDDDGGGGDDNADCNSSYKLIGVVMGMIAMVTIRRGLWAVIAKSC